MATPRRLSRTKHGGLPPCDLIFRGCPLVIIRLGASLRLRDPFFLGEVFEYPFELHLSQILYSDPLPG
jgi:hypothetical protein